MKRGSSVRERSTRPRPHKYTYKKRIFLQCVVDIFRWEYVRMDGRIKKNYRSKLMTYIYVCIKKELIFFFFYT